MNRLLAMALVLCSGLVWAQSPEEDFVPWTGPSANEQPSPPPETPAPTPPPDAPTAVTPPPPAPTAPAPTSRPAPAAEVKKAPSPQDFNRVSLYGGLTLGQLKRAVGFYLGFPLVGVKAGIGLLDSLDVGVGFDSFYGSMNEPRAFLKYQLVRDTHWSVAAQAEGGIAFFTQEPQADPIGARWLTGRRNYNLEGGIVASYQGDSVQSARLFLDGRYHLSFDTQPYTSDPLGGVPPPVVLGHNVNLRLGAEMPFSPSTSFLFIFGFDVHGRGEDAPVMPALYVGLVTGV